MGEHEKWSQSEIICPWILLITEFNEQFTKHAIDERSYWAYTHWLLVWLTAQNDRMFFAYHQNGDYRNAVRYVRVC